MPKKTFPETFYEHPLQKHAESAAKWALTGKLTASMVNDLAIAVQQAMVLDKKLTRDQAILDVIGLEQDRIRSGLTVPAAQFRAETMAKLDSILELWLSIQASEIA